MKELNTTDKTIIHEVSKRIEYYINWEDFLLSSISFPNELTKSVINIIISQPNKKPTDNLEEILENFQNICETNDIDPQFLITVLDNTSVQRFDETFVPKIPNYYFEEACNNNSILAKNSIQTALSYFDSISQDEWTEVFRDLTQDKYKLLIIINYVNWNSHALEALKKTLIEIVIREEIKDREEIERIIVSFEKANKDLTNTFKDVRDEFINRRNINAQLFEFFGPWLIKYASLKEKPGDVIRTIFNPRLLDYERCLDIIIENRENLKELIEQAPKEEVSDFKEAIRVRKNQDIEEINLLAAELNIDKQHN